MSTDALWYLARGSGVVSLVLLTTVVVLGIATRRGRSFLGLPRLAVVTVHRSTALMAVVFLVVHVTTLMFDPYAQLRVVDLVLPFTAEYRPLWTGLGTLALDLTLALVVTSLARDRLPLKAWRGVHLAAYALWPMALLHGVFTGTDRTSLWMIAVDVACLAAVAGALVIHPALQETPAAARRPAARTASRPRQEALR
ncbi:ferric reductase-like transmembrane domain-containing protein [Spongisporangium articulatum]|uniref:Ferric reductase-like transmembrane domain-containing protein n=1 Tax=Spongisporangium articulatum TaxID=3362603 RepID=A0ABW8AJI3_9ACTN